MSPTRFRPTRSVRPIPGVSGRRIPGSARMPSPRAVGKSGFLSNVPFQKGGSSVFREAHRQQVRDTKGRFAGGWGFAWQGLEQVDSNLVDWNHRVHSNLRDAMESLKDDMVQWMKDNKTWEDHTYAAVENLQGHVVWHDDDHFTIFVGHGAEVFYGIWLEVRWGGRFAIVVPAVEHFGPQIGARLRTMT